MTLRQTTFSPVLRSVAAVTLFAWLAALICCAEICGAVGDAANPESSHCHADADADSHHHDNSPIPSHHGPCGSTSCLTLRNALLGNKVTTALSPHLVPLYTLPAFVVTFADTDTASHLTFRHAKPRDWVFTPEVCLGPAFRSLAPPLA